MKENVIMNVKNVREAYEAPKCEVIEMQNEGTILTGSGGDSINASIEDFEEDIYNGWN